MPKFANFVQVTLVSAITAGGLVIEVEAQAPFNLPPDPAGEKAFLTFMDNVNSPTAFEIISYTGTNFTGATTVELTGVTRAEQNTSAQAWDAGAVVRQDLTSTNLSIFDDVFRRKEFFVLGGNDASVRVIGADGVTIWQSLVQEDDVDAAAVGVNGDVAIHFNGGGIVKFDNKGNKLWSTSDFNSNVDMAIGSDGTLFVSENSFAPNNVAKYAPDGTREFFRSDPVMEGIIGVSNGDVIYVEAEDSIGNHRLGIADTNLNTLIIIGGSSSSFTIDRTAAKNDLVYEGFGPIINAADRDGNVEQLVELQESWFSDFTGPGEFTILQLDIRDIESFVNEDLAVIVSVKLEDFTTGDIRYADYLVMIDKNGSLMWTKLINSTYFGLDDITEAPGVSVQLISTGSGLVLSRRFGPQGDIQTEFMGIDAQFGFKIWQNEPIDTFFEAKVSGPVVAETPIFYDGFESRMRFPKREDVVGMSNRSIATFIEAEGEVVTPPTGKAYVFLDSADGAFKVKFDNGTVKTIVSP